MRSGALFVAAFLLAGCGASERESMDPGTMQREAVARGQSREYEAHRETVVRCACDADGGLHVQAPDDARVTATGPGAADIVFDEGPPRRPIRTTVSLGYIGDNPLTPNVSYGGPWNAPDGVLPKHSLNWNTPSFYYSRPYYPRGRRWR